MVASGIAATAAPRVDEACAKPAHEVEASSSARRPPAEIPAATPTPPNRFEAMRTPMLRRREEATDKDYGLRFCARSYRFYPNLSCDCDLSLFLPVLALILSGVVLLRIRGSKKIRN